jgi:hypothetical protein
MPCANPASRHELRKKNARPFRDSGFDASHRPGMTVQVAPMISSSNFKQREARARMLAAHIAPEALRGIALEYREGAGKAGSSPPPWLRAESTR